MIEKVAFENFKCFPKFSMDFSPITILSGLNSTGKSSIIEALLLLRQSKLSSNKDKEFPLSLNGKYIQVGTGEDVLYEDAQIDEIVISIGCLNGGQCTWSWSVDVGSSESILRNESFINIGEDYKKLNLFAEGGRETYLNFAYLSAERIGPRTAYRIPDENMKMNPEIGKRGEYASYYLEFMGGEEIPIPKLSFSDKTPLNIITQINAWMSIISPGVRIVPRSHRDIDMVKLRYQYEHTKGISREHRPINVGFGLTYVMPIILAILTAQPGSLLLIESPEAHLHPKGQTELGKLMARASQNGVQIIAETHSDHLINGIRVAVKEKAIDKEKVAIQFLANSVTQKGTSVQRLHIDENGKLDEWPNEFLSEWEKNLLKLI